MEQHIEQILEKARGVKLEPRERDDMERNIRLYMSEHPIPDTFFERLSAYVGGVSLGLSMRPVFAGVLIVFLVGGGTSYTAADALPGDALYPFKIHVNERVGTVFTLSEKAQVERSATLAVRRLEEAEVLATEGRITPEVRVEIEHRFNQHVEEFEERAAKLAKEETALETLTEVEAYFEASLHVHEQVLADISVRVPSVSEEVEPIRNSVARRALALRDIRSPKIETISMRSATEEEEVRSEDTITATLSVQAPEVEEVSNVALPAAQVPTSSATSTDVAQGEIEEGLRSLKERRYNEAFKTFDRAIRTIKRDNIEIQARSRSRE